MALQAEQSPAGCFSSQENWISEHTDAWGPVCLVLDQTLGLSFLRLRLYAAFDATGAGLLETL